MQTVTNEPFLGKEINKPPQSTLNYEVRESKSLREPTAPSLQGEQKV